MRIIVSENKDPYLHLAAEEYLLRREGDYCLLWSSRPSVIIGKHQNAWAEINPGVIRDQQLPVARRISGGGAVFHDPGNLNFSFLLTALPGQQVNFRKYTAPIVSTLRSVGVQATFGNRNDLRVGGVKVSGNAEHVFKNRVLHHGTLLFDTDLEELNRVLRVNPFRYQGRAVRSVRSRVGNIRPLLHAEMEVEGFRDYLATYLAGETGGEHFMLPADDLKAIELLAASKYRTWDWIFGHSPDFTGQGECTLREGRVMVSFRVSKGFLSGVEFRGALPTREEGVEWSAALDGVRYRFDEVLARMHSVNHRTGLREEEMAELAGSFF